MFCEKIISRIISAVLAVVAITSLLFGVKCHDEDFVKIAVLLFIGAVSIFVLSEIYSRFYKS